MRSSSSSEYVFTNRAGRPLTHRVAAVFRRTVAQLGIHDLPVPRPTARHDFRDAATPRRHGARRDRHAPRPHDTRHDAEIRAPWSRGASRGRAATAIPRGHWDRAESDPASGNGPGMTSWCAQAEIADECHRGYSCPGDRLRPPIHDDIRMPKVTGFVKLISFGRLHRVCLFVASAIHPLR